MQGGSSCGAGRSAAASSAGPSSRSATATTAMSPSSDAWPASPNIPWLGPFGQQGGFTAWALWLGIHIFYLIGFSNRIVVLDPLGLELPHPWSWHPADHGQAAPAADRGARAARPAPMDARSDESDEESVRRLRRRRAGRAGRAAAARPQSNPIDLPDALAARACREGGLEPVERDPPVDEPVGGQPSGEMQRRIPREVGRRVGEPVVRAEDPAAAVDDG